MDERRLQSIPVFADLSKQDLRAVARLADEVDISEGKELTKQGSLSYEFFAIISGTAEVTVDGRAIAERGPGDVIGEMGAIADTRRNATVIATSPITLAVMTARDLRHIEREMPRVHDRLQAAISERKAALSG
ncbi:MAG: family transcriptional regulator, cyclic receptor protein [Solirubrobacteraceae bacterium]|jgi:CRP-like cAMP-binding protein|nr:family transcriptional regulator, cyclic receptor protein [Solirubrobacteraceae bacterium]